MELVTKKSDCKRVADTMLVKSPKQICKKAAPVKARPTYTLIKPLFGHMDGYIELGMIGAFV
jgi:hypothetical protein